MIQNTLFSFKKPQQEQKQNVPILNGMYYDTERDMFVSYALGQFHNEWQEKEFPKGHKQKLINMRRTIKNEQ